MKLIFLGTGASGQTPGHGKSKRLESSLFIKNKKNISIDITRNFEKQSFLVDHIDYLLITHAHRDAIGGISQLRLWWRKQKQKPIDVFANKQTIQKVQNNFKQLDHLYFIEVKNNRPIKIFQWTITALEVPHTNSLEFPTNVWKIEFQNKSIIYASDIAYLTQQFRNFCQKASILIIDSAMWKKKIFSHLTINQELKKICKWHVDKILLTHIGKTVPPHEELKEKLIKG